MQQLRIGYLSTMYHTSHILKHFGLVEKRLNLQPRWRLFGTGPAMVQAFAEGGLDAGYIGLPPAMIAVGKGVSIRCIGGGHVEGTVMIGRSEFLSVEELGSEAGVIRQLQDRTVAAPSAGSIHDVLARDMLKRFGADRAVMKNVTWADLIPAALDDKTIDAAFGTPPLAVLSCSLHGHRILVPPSAIWPFNPSYGIVVRTGMLQQEQLLQDFLAVHEEACNQILHKSDTAARAVAQEVGVVDASFVKQVFAVSPRYCASLPENYIESSMKFVPVLQSMGYLTRALSTDEVFFTDFIRKVHPQQHHYCEPLRE